MFITYIYKNQEYFQQCFVRGDREYVCDIFRVLTLKYRNSLTSNSLLKSRHSEIGDTKNKRELFYMHFPIKITHSLTLLVTHRIVWNGTQIEKLKHQKHITISIIFNNN